MDIAGHRILIFGDSLSHVGPDGGPAQATISIANGSDSQPGAVLGAHLIADGANAVRINARVGRSAYNFWRREDTAALIAADLEWQPTDVIVMLGTNDLGLNLQSDEAAMRTIRLVYVDKGMDVWAIGPPSFASPTMQAQARPVAAMMARVFGDHFIDARPITSDLTSPTYRTGDGVHFKQAGAKVFGERLAKVVREGVSPGWGPAVMVAGGFLALWRLVTR